MRASHRGRCAQTNESVTAAEPGRHPCTQGVGVGAAGATAATATAQFVLRDMAGMLGGVAFAMRHGSALDADAKKWRLFADCMNNVGMALELAAPV